MERIQRFQGCLLGLAAGDAVGTAVEFRPRGSFPPVTGMSGGGPFGLKAGEWTDDTSMALCLAESLVDQGGFDAADQMNRYLRWFREGYWSSNGRCFDIGNTVSGALNRFAETGDPFSGSTDPMTAGNGSIMRLAPVVLYYFPDHTQVLHYAAESSRTTHGALECLDACRLLADVLYRALSGADKNAVLTGTSPKDLTAPALRELAAGEYRKLPAKKIQGTGYVVKSLEAALWCFDTTGTFEQAILAAANLGDDADTTAAICGQVAGAYYGVRAIPAGWLAKLARREEITHLAERLMTHEKTL